MSSNYLRATSRCLVVVKYSVNVMMLTLSVLFQGGDKESERGAQTQGAAAAVVQPGPAGAAGDLHVQLLQVDQHQLAAGIARHSVCVPAALVRFTNLMYFRHVY